MAAVTRAASAEAIADGTTRNISLANDRPPAAADVLPQTTAVAFRGGPGSKGRCRKLLQSDPAGRAREADQEQRAAGLPVEFGRLTGFDPQAGKGTELRIVM